MGLKMCHTQLWMVAMFQEAYMGLTPEKLILERCPKDYEGAVFCNIKCRKDTDEDNLGKVNCTLCWMRTVEVPTSMVHPKYQYDISKSKTL